MVWVLSTMSMHAVPTNRKPFTVKQKDGSLIEICFIGDENYNYYSTLDGVPVVKQNDSYFYAAEDSQGKLVATSMLVHERNMRSAAELAYVEQNSEKLQSHIQHTWKERLDRRNAQLLEKMQARSVKRKAMLGQSQKYEGKKKGLVILVNYSDLKMKSTNTREAWDDQFNQNRYNKNNHYGSVRDYFYEQSYGKLDIEFDVVGPYTVSKDWRYYGKNSDTGSDIHPCQLVTEACKLANPDVDFKDYDWDGDGEVDQVFVIYAGYSAASGYDEDAVWPHEWHLAYGAYYGDGQGALMVDGVRVDNYAVSAELRGTTGSNMDCIGVAVHEFSHCLGLPDMYDVKSSGTQCMDYWDVLDQGCYSGPGWAGEVPTGYSAYERYFAGWLEFEELKDPKRVSGMKNLGDTAQAYIYYNKNHKNEFFIMENRQAKAWFRYPANAHGMLIYHVDYDKSAWESNGVNSEASHPRMVFIPADNSYTRQYENQMTSDFFPGTKDIKTINNTSHQKCYGRWFNKNEYGTYDMNMELTSISENNGKISFLFNGGETAVRKKLRNLIADIKPLLEVPHSDSKEGATSMLEQAIADAEEMAENLKLSTEEYNAAYDNLRKAAVDFVYGANPTTEEPFDVTFCYTNPAIASNEGWKEETSNNGFSYSNNCGEYTNMKFTLGQTSAYKLPKGNYKATCQAFQRAGSIEETTSNIVNTYFMAKSKTAKIMNIVDDAQPTKKSTTDTQIGDGLYVPTSIKYANNYFKAGLYTNTLEFSNTLDAGSTVKIGLKCSLAKANYWTCFNGFKLYFLGNPDATGIEHVDTDASTAQYTDVYDLTGRKTALSAGKGIYVVGNKKILVK